MNPETEREVWSRVLTPGQMTAEEALLPERLEALISLERRNAAELKVVSARLRGADRAAFLRMAARDEARAAELQAMHYLLTGRRLRLSGRAEPLPRDLPEALRMLWLRRREMARSYAELCRNLRPVLRRDAAADGADFCRPARTDGLILCKMEKLGKKTFFMDQSML